MALKNFRFELPFNVPFPNGLVLIGGIERRTEYKQNVPEEARRQSTDTETGLKEWKAKVTDPSEKNAKRASFELIFLADVQPVPASEEIVPGTGMRMIELEGLTAEPKVMGQGEFKYLGYTYRARGIKGDNSGAKVPPADIPASRPARGDKAGA
ncbi:hypothetical protein [Nocardia otitidiscaviarum]|uniref:hypothetical protein n=1 Tax=Nocardia otitidiscaviarum TaxID=1823 RepID=UPI00245623D5|nr:hypothetical protein [Nocardia otitidiscaviarum]